MTKSFSVRAWYRLAARVVAFYIQRVKENKNAIRWTRLSCPKFRDNAVRHQFHALAYNTAFRLISG